MRKPSVIREIESMRTTECQDPEVGSHRNCDEEPVYLSLPGPQLMQIFRTPFGPIKSLLENYYDKAIAAWDYHVSNIAKALCLSIEGRHYSEPDMPDGTVGEGSGNDDKGLMPYRTMAGVSRFRDLNARLVRDNELGLLFLRTRMVKLMPPYKATEEDNTWTAAWISEIALGIQCDGREYTNYTLLSARQDALIKTFGYRRLALHLMPETQSQLAKELRGWLR